MNNHSNEEVIIWAIVCGDWRLTATKNPHQMSQELVDYLALRGWKHPYMSRCFGPEVKITDPQHRAWWADEAEDAVKIGHAEHVVIFGHKTCGKFTAKERGLGIESDKEDAKHWELGPKAVSIIAELSGLPTEYVYHANNRFLTEAD